MNYFNNPAMSQSKLKDLKKSPKHFWAKHINPDRLLQEETEAMRFGSAAHMCLLEPQLFMETYIAMPSINRKTNVGKEAYAQFIEENKGKTVITTDDMVTVKRMRDAVLNKKISRLLLNNGQAEVELYWKDKDTGIHCKAKLDYVIKPSSEVPTGLIPDLKTTTNANPDAFAKSAYDFGYYNQAAWYEEAFFQNYGTRPPFVFIAVEKTEPFECGFFAADEQMLEIGRKENRRLLNLYNECQTNNRWPGYEDKINSIGLPGWALNKFNFEENLI